MLVRVLSFIESFTNSVFSKAGIIDAFEGTTGHLGTQGHQGPITGVDTHSAFGQVTLM